VASLGLFLVSQAAAFAKPIDAAAVDAVVQEALQAWHAPGAAIAIVHNDEVVYLQGYGVRELGSQQPVTPDTLFAIASCTKAFTTTAMAMLVDDGKMAWDDPVRKHVPFFRLADPLADQSVTLRDLVCHRTGLGRHDLLWYRAPWSLEESVRRIGHVKLSHPFRSTYEYANIPYTTAGFAVAAASGSTWHDFVQTRIFDPLGMSGAVFTSSAVQQAPDHASPHQRDREGQVKVIPWYPDDQQIRGAGSIKAGARDLSKWLRFQLGDGTFAGRRLVSAANLAETHTPEVVIRLSGAQARQLEATQASYGLGWRLHDYRGHLLVWHGGSTDGFRSQTTLVPKARLGLVVLTNLGNTELPAAVSNSLVDRFLDLPTRDWNASYLEQVKRTEAAQKARARERAGRRHPGTKPSRELAAYAGTYEEPAYGQARIAVEDGTLVVAWSSFTSRLEHYHFDTFTATADNRLRDEQAVFTLGADGEVATMSFLGVSFHKVQPKPAAPSAPRPGGR
jgi:CubicO group peptidase (beta-lactamase class C family)